MGSLARAPLDRALAQRWTQELPRHAGEMRWSWFEGAVAQSLQRSWGAAGAQALHTDLVRLCTAFLDWSQLCELAADHANIDPVDHAHFVSGQLLSCLVLHTPFGRAQPVLQLASSEPEQAEWARQSRWALWPQGWSALCLVLTMLQAWRWRLKAGDLPWQAERFEQCALSFQENLREDPHFAIPYLDLCCGLEPLWESATLITERPAMRSARQNTALGLVPGPAAGWPAALN